MCSGLSRTGGCCCHTLRLAWAGGCQPAPVPCFLSVTSAGGMVWYSSGFHLGSSPLSVLLSDALGSGGCLYFTSRLTQSGFSTWTTCCDAGSGPRMHSCSYWGWCVCGCVCLFQFVFKCFLHMVPSLLPLRRGENFPSIRQRVSSRWCWQSLAVFIVVLRAFVVKTEQSKSHSVRLSTPVRCCCISEFFFLQVFPPPHV